MEPPPRRVAVATSGLEACLVARSAAARDRFLRRAAKNKTPAIRRRSATAAVPYAITGVSMGFGVEPLLVFALFPAMDGEGLIE